jgi:hypothetical protein
MLLATVSQNLNSDVQMATCSTMLRSTCWLRLSYGRGASLQKFHADGFSLIWILDSYCIDTEWLQEGNDLEPFTRLLQEGCRCFSLALVEATELQAGPGSTHVVLQT